MIYLTIFNTIAVLLLVVETMFYMETQHKTKSCLYNIDQMWCYYDLHCSYPNPQSDFS